MSMISLIDISYAIAILILVVLGLAIIFGMLRVINMAHGEKIMLGAYAVYLCERLPFSPLVNMLCGVLLAILSTAVVGAIMYWCIIKRIKQRLLDTILATWGVSIVLKQLVVIAFGAQGQHVTAPINSVITLFGSDYPVYRLVVLGASIVALLCMYFLFFKSHFGVQARAVMSNPTLASCIGINRNTMNLYSFIIGSAVAGFAGAMIAPLMSISPFLGADYLVPAFLAVLIGGLGSISASIMGAGIIAGIESGASIFVDSVFAKIMMLAIAVILLKIFPNGMFGKK